MIYMFVVCKYVYIYTQKDVYLRLICLRNTVAYMNVRICVCIYIHYKHVYDMLHRICTDK